MSRTAGEVHYLVIGDLMIDRTWVVTRSPSGSTSQSHFGVDPRKLLEPGRFTDILGGAAGLLARGIAVLDETAHVSIACAFDGSIAAGADDGSATPGEGPTRLGRPLVPEKDARARIKLEKLAETDFLTLKWRLYSYQKRSSKGHGENPFHLVLEQRLDRDLSLEGHRASDVQLLRGLIDRADIILINDFSKGLLQVPSTGVNQLVEVLRQIPPGSKQVILRSKQSKAPLDVPCTLLCADRDDFVRHVAGLGVDEERRQIISQGRALRKIGDGEYSIRPEILAALKLLRKRCSIHTSILLTLDKEGAILVTSNDDVYVMPLSAGDVCEAAGVGAGDFLKAKLAVGMVNMGMSIPEASRAAVTYATAYCKHESVDKTDGWYGRVLDPDKICLAASTIRIEECRVEKLEVLERESTRAGNVRRRGIIELHRGGWYLESFLTVTPGLGYEIARLQRRIRGYFREKGDLRPFVVALCGPPGAGKSHLARCLGKSLPDCEVLSENAAQWMSLEELFALCERIRSVQLRRKFPLAFIDEVDSLVNNEAIYGKLLAPLWDGEYGVHRHRIGPTVFVLAGSSGDWSTRAALLGEKQVKRWWLRFGERNTLDERGKLNDLVSRLSTAPVEITPLKDRKDDALYLIAEKFVSRFPQIEKVSSRVMEFLREAAEEGARSVTKVVSMLQAPVDRKVFRFSDLNLEESQDIYRLFLDITTSVVGDSSDNEFIEIRK